MTDEQLAVFKAHGFQPVATLSSEYEIDAIRAQRNETLAKEKASIDALHGTGVKKAKNAAGDIHAQRADYYENLGGRWLSVEANAEGATYTGTGTNAGNVTTLTRNYTVIPLRPTSTGPGWHRRRHVVARPRRTGAVRAVHAGRGEDLHGDHHGDRDLDGR